jgi:RHS repeat-associated protein
MSIQGGSSSTYAYYPDGSLKTIDWSPTAGQFQWAYTPAGHYQSVTFPNGQARTYAYDDQGRLLYLSNTLGATTLASFAYGYDVNNQIGQSTMLGQRTSLTATVPPQGLNNALSKYYYDSLYQLTQADYPSGPPFNAEVDQWTYDAIGNRLTTTVNASTQTHAYLKNGANPLNGQRLSSDGVNAYTWDGNGSNLTRNGTPGNFTFSYDADNRLNSISGPTTASYTYDYQGRRTSKTVAGVTTTYIYDAMNLVSEISGATISTYVFGPGIDEPLAQYRLGQVSYFAADGLGTIAVTTDPTGSATLSTTFDVWGNTKAETGPRLQPFTYTGREVGEAALLFYRARFLQPVLGMFTQEDPLPLTWRLFREVNDYVYVRRSPAVFTDPSGGNIHGNWCGPGGKGAAIDATDACCKAHDECYNKANANWINNTFGIGSKNKKCAIADCNADLCACLRSAEPSSGKERFDLALVYNFFKCGPFPPSPPQGETCSAGLCGPSPF